MSDNQFTCGLLSHPRASVLGVVGAIFVGVCVPNRALAWTVNNRYCVDLDVAFSDQWQSAAATGLGPPDDILATDADVDAVGLLYYVHETTGTTTVLHDHGFLGQSSDAFPGCTPQIPMDTAKRYSFSVFSVATVGDDAVQILASTQSPSFMGVIAHYSNPPVIPTSWNPNPVRNLRVRVGLWTDTIAVAVKALERFDTPGSDVYTIYPYSMDQENPGETDLEGNEVSRSRLGEIFMRPADRSNRFTVAHELGHSIVHFETGGGIPKSDEYENATLACDTGSEGHVLDGVEYSASALSEGWANFVAIKTLNRINQVDCWFKSGPIDWNQDGSRLEYFTALVGTASARPEEVLHWADCEGDLHPYGLSDEDIYVGGDHLTNACGVDGDPGVGVEMDWMRMFWDMHTDANLSTADLLDIIALAKTGGCWDEAEFTSSACNPNQRMALAALATGGFSLYTTWLAEAVYNGVNP